MSAIYTIETICRAKIYGRQVIARGIDTLIYENHKEIEKAKRKCPTKLGEKKNEKRETIGAWNERRWQQ